MPPTNPAPSPSAPAVLAELLARTALGDRAAFATLYQRSAAHLMGVILRIQPDRALAEDLLQEIYVKVWHAAGSFDAQRAQPLTWLTSIARHRAIDSLRRARGEPTWVTARPGAESDEDDSLLNQLAGPDDEGPAALLARAHAARAVGDCLEQLQGEQQQSLALAFYQGLSHAEVADHLRQPLGTVKSWVRRGLQALKRCLQSGGRWESEAG